MNNLERLNYRKQELKNQIKSINKEIEEIEYEDIHNTLLLLVGKCYIEEDKHHSNWITVWKIYKLNKLQLYSIKVSYINNNDTYFNIEYQNHFNPIAEQESGLEHYYTEISNDEFMNHYNYCLNLINTAIL